MAKKKIELFIEINNEKEFNNILNHNSKRLICAEVYCSFSGPCTALDRLFNTIKLDWSDGQMVLLRVLADEIESLKRFLHQSQPIFMFIRNKKVTTLIRGVDNMRFAEIAKKELFYYKQEMEGLPSDRRMFNIDEPLPEELEWQYIRAAKSEQEIEITIAGRVSRQAARKRHRAELMVPHLQHLNFVLYWPHCKHAHPELYERWDLHNIIMVGREKIQLTKDIAEDILYAGDAPLNEASLHVLLSSPSLAICFRLLDTDKHFVSLVRKILYEDLTPLDEDKTIEDQLPQKTAFDNYKSHSLSNQEIWKLRREERIKRKDEKEEKRARRLSELQRLARQAIEEAIQAKRAEKERRKLELLKSGNLTALEELKREPDNDEVDIMVPEKLSDEENQESSTDEDEDEYFPPAGLLIPGFYAPPNDIAKTNGLAVLFPKLVSENVKPAPEYLPPHVLVMLDIVKRYKAVKAMTNYHQAIIHMGIFQATSPYDAKHIAYSVKQFDSLKMDCVNLKLIFMVSIESDRALLELMDLSPVHVSRDATVGEEECSLIFSVDYADNYPEFEDFC